MALYVGLYWFWASLAGLVRKRGSSRVLAWVFLIFLLVFAGARLGVGCDTRAYALRFSTMYQGMGWQDALHMGEGLFNWLNMSVINLGGSFSTLVFVCTLIFLVCLYRFSLLAASPVSVMVLSFPVLVVQLAMSGLRQALAVAMLMLAFRSFVLLRRWQVVFWILVASQFHTSVLVFLPIAALVGRQISLMRLIAAITVLGPLAMFFLGSRLEVYNDRYVDQIYGSQESSGAWLRYALVVFPFIVFEWKRRLVKARFPELFPLFRLFALITFALVPLGLVSSVALHRFVFYMMPVSILVLLCIGAVALRKEQWRMGAALPFLVHGAYITVWFSMSSHSTVCYVPYSNWLLAGTL
ncbi:EpsG family protein [Thermomonas sp.]|uniref:EpsG family protein n=1 Tax=Thermomonas sp. TaxID=1971895 RepID=UPI00262A2B97|nr:EpsG family protein [Thermomonas sp.]MCO5054640.1 EpsG family protein [Thermomonas sp.]